MKRSKKLISFLLVCIMLLSTFTVNAAELTSTEETTETTAEGSTDVSTQTSTEDITTESPDDSSTSQFGVDSIIRAAEEQVIEETVQETGASGEYRMYWLNSSYVRSGSNIYIDVNNVKTTHKQMLVAKLAGSDSNVRPAFCIEKGVALSSGTWYDPKPMSNSYITLDKNPWLRYRIAYALKFGESRQLFYGPNTSNYTTLQTSSYVKYLATQMLIWDYIYHGNEANYNSGSAGPLAQYGVNSVNCGNTDSWNGFGGELTYWYMTYSQRIQNARRIPSFLSGAWGSNSATPNSNYFGGSYQMTFNDTTGKYEYTLSDTRTNTANYDNQSYYSTHPTPLSCCKITSSDASVTWSVAADGKSITFYSDNPITDDVKIQFLKNDFDTSNNLTDVALYGAADGSDNQYMALSAGSIPTPGGYILLLNDEVLESWVEIEKIDEDSRQIIPGIGFDIYTEELCTNLVSSGITNSSGKLVLKLDPGDYWVKEVSCPSNYILDSTPRKVTLVNEQTTSITITNKRKALIQINKKDEVTLTAMKNIEFGVYTDETCNSLVQSVTTDKYGQCNFYLPEGTYYIKELQTDEQHFIDDTVHKIVATNQNTNVINLTNKPKGKIRINKVGDKVIGTAKKDTAYGTYNRLTFSKENLEGVEFTIYDQDGNVVDVITTDADGEAISDYLEVATYTVEETKTPKGLAKLPGTFEVEVKAITEIEEDTLGEQYTDVNFLGMATVENDVVSSEINVYKTGEILNIENGTYSYGSKPLEGVVFGVYTNEDITNAAGEVVLAKDNCIGYLITNEDGKATLRESLVGGSYYYKEVKALEGYILDDTKKKFEVELGNEATTVININKENPDMNMLYKTGIQLVKVDKSDSKITLEGVQFELYKKTAEGVEDELMGTFVTNEFGFIEIDGLPFGSYYFKEIKAKDGYVLDNKAIDIVVDGSAENINIDFANEKKPTPPTPKTGDSVTPGIIISILLVAIGGVCFITFRKKKNAKG